MVSAWTQRNGDELAEAAQRAYAEARLAALPSVASSAQLTTSLCDGYRQFTVLMLDAVRDFQRQRGCAVSVEEKRRLLTRAQAMRDAWQVLHDMLVALHLRELRGCESGGAAEGTVLLAERCVEALTDNLTSTTPISCGDL